MLTDGFFFYRSRARTGALVIKDRILYGDDPNAELMVTKFLKVFPLSLFRLVNVQSCFSDWGVTSRCNEVACMISSFPLQYLPVLLRPVVRVGPEFQSHYWCVVEQDVIDRR